MIREALQHYDFAEPDFVFIRHNENMTYEIRDGVEKFLLRIHKPAEGLNFSFQRGERSMQVFLRSEIELLQKIISKTDLRVQRPIRNKHDEYITELQSGDYATVLSWIDGDDMTDLPMTQEIVYGIGRLIGRLHNHMSDFHQANRYCYDDCMMKRVLNEITEAHNRKHISDRHYQCVCLFLHKFIKLLKKEKHKFIFIHGDLNKSNLIYNKQEIIPIDFSLSGYALPETDLADMSWSLSNDKLKPYLIDGYKSISKYCLNDHYIEVCSAISLVLYIAYHHGKFCEDETLRKLISKWIHSTIEPVYNKMHP
jgi:Ser/Thr protein kinase RdoA (MazF antagonist)